MLRPKNIRSYWLKLTISYGMLMCRHDSIFPPQSGHPDYNLHADDIDFQIEADYIGFMCPGMPQTANKMADKIGHIMN